MSYKLTNDTKELLEKVELLLQWKEEHTNEKGTFDVNTNQYFLIVMGLVIYFMQCGFAFLEAGSVRAKNTTNILLKNMLDSAIGGVIYWVCGYAFAFGGDRNSFIGEHGFFLINISTEYYPFYFFHFVFAATAATIVSGAMAERTQFVAYLVYSVVITGFVYPIVTHWTWSANGWLASKCWWSDISYQDFAGSGVVHCVGGAAGLCGALLLGPRLGQVVDGKPVRIMYHTTPLMSLGGFILIFGFFAFNGGSQASISAEGDGAAVGKSIVNTIISGSFGGLSAMLCTVVRERRVSLLACINGMLTGMVAICAGCNVVPGWGAAVTGIVGGVVFRAWSKMIFRAGIDDPLDAVAVHLGGGLWGVLAVTLFSSDYGLFLNWDATSLKHIVWNLIGVIVIIAWTSVITGSLFLTLKLCNLLRVSEEVEKQGIDIAEHKEPAYPTETFASTEMEDFMRKHLKIAYEEFHAHTNAALVTTPAVSDSQLDAEEKSPQKGTENPGAYIENF